MTTNTKPKTKTGHGGGYPRRFCEVCGREIFSFMKENIAAWEDTGMCAVCCFGEADLIDQ